MVVRALGYLRLQTPQYREWGEFAVNVLGLMQAEVPRDDALYFRIDERPYRLALVSGHERAIEAIGLEVADDTELEHVARHVQDHGYRVTQGSPEAARERLVSAFVSFEDPGGIPIEVFYGPMLDHTRLVTPLVNGFVTADQGLGHIVLAVAQPSETVDFFRQVLGFKLRNTVHVTGLRADSESTVVSFLGCNPRQHTVGIVGMDVPGNLLHIMFEVQSLDDVGCALDRCTDLGVPLATTLGRHTNDRMVSFYCVSPDGVQIEFGWGGMQVAQSDDSVYETTKGSLWGHRQVSPTT